MQRDTQIFELIEAEKERIEGVVITINGAGSVEVNGEYSFCGIKCASGMYERYAPYSAVNSNTNEIEVIERARYMIYKCEVKTKGHQWFISVVRADQPGTSNDIDF